MILEILKSAIPHAIVSLLIIIPLVYFYLIYKFNYWKRKGVYYEKPHMIFGNIKDLLNGKYTENELYNMIYKNMGENDVAGIYYFWKPCLLIKNPDIIKKIMISDFEYFTDHPSISDHSTTDKSLWSLFTMEGHIWKSRRAMFSLAFTPKKIKEYFKGIEKQLELYLPLFNEKADKNEEIELEGFTSKYLMNVITNTMFGLTTDSVDNPDSKFVECGKYTTEPSVTAVLKIIMRNLSPTFYEILKLKTFPSKLWHSFYPFVKDIVENRENNGIIKDDIIGMMIRQKNNQNSGIEMKLEEMVGHVYSFFEAGYDTTSLTMSYCLYELSKNMKVQETLRNEIDEFLSERNRALNYEAISDLPYMDKVVKETLRKYPPAGLIKRICTKNYKLGSLEIKKGMHIFIPAEALHYDTKYYSDPEKFDPDREYEHPFAYLPFGAGPRICIGMKVAEVTVKIGLLQILSKFIIQPSELHREPIEYDPKTIFIYIRPKNGIWAKVLHRKK